MNIISDNKNISFNSNSNQIEIQDIKSALSIKNNTKALNFKTPQVIITGGKVNDILVNGESVLDEQGKANIIIPEIPDTSEFIKNTVDNLVNYYLKSETYSKEEIDELANTIASAGYATEKWVREQNYMPIEDFREYMNFFHYTKDEIDKKLQELPFSGTEYKADDNIIIEDETIKAYTNTGYKIIDKDIQLQSITTSETTGTNKIVYMEDKEIAIIYDGSDKIRRSENGIDFDEIITLPCVCKYMTYNSNNSVLFGTDASNNFIYSSDTGLTWNIIKNSYANGLHQMAIGFGTGFRATYKSTKEIISWSYNVSNNSLSQNSRIKSTIVPEFTAMINNSQFIWCNSTGAFKYGAGSQEGDFASLSGITINLLKRVNNITMLGLKNDNRIYLLEPANSVTAYKWLEYILPDTCTVNDIIFNPYDETYYVFTDINTYYKTKDFINFDSIEKNELRGLQGHFTLMGIQMTTINHDELLLAPTRTKIENKLQEHDRGLNKSLWVGNGLELTGEDKVNVKTDGNYLGVNSNGIFLREVDEWHLTQDIIESVYVAKAQEKDLFDPYELENWYYSDEAYPTEAFKAVKFIFSQAGSFYDQVTWETEYFVEQYEYGYLFYDVNMSIFKYVKLGNKSWMFE